MSRTYDYKELAISHIELHQTAPKMQNTDIAYDHRSVTSGLSLGILWEICDDSQAGALGQDSSTGPLSMS